MAGIRYCSDQDILGQIEAEALAKIAGDGVEYDVEILDNEIVEASAEIDGYILSRYDAQTIPVQGMLRKCCVDIVIYNLYTRKMTPPDYRVKRYDDAIEWLRGVSSGAISLGDSPSVNTVSISSETRIFTRSCLADF